MFKLIFLVAVIVTFLYMALRFLFVMSYPDHDKLSEDELIKFNRICLHAGLKMNVRPSNEPLYYITYIHDKILYQYYNSHVSFSLNLRPYGNFTGASFVEKSECDTMNVEFDYLYFRDKSRLVRIINEKFGGYENYSKATEIDIAKQDEILELQKVKETDLISKMLEAERIGDKHQEELLLDQWEAQYSNKQK